MKRRSNIIKKKIINYIPWGLLAIITGLFLAQMFHLANLDRDIQAMGYEIKTLRTERDILLAQLEGQAMITQKPPNVRANMKGMPV